MRLCVRLNDLAHPRRLVPLRPLAGAEPEFKSPRGFKQVRDYLVAQQENQRDIERVRNTCSTGAGKFCRRQ